MYKERIEKLLEELRSGRYSQTRGQLRHENEYCCLGVAEDVRGCTWKSDAFGILRADGIELGVLTNKGREYYGFSQHNGEFNDISHEQSLSQLNDNGMSFERIADKIEYCMENPATELFIPEVYEELVNV